MHKFLLISWREYSKLVGQRGFWLGTLAFPFMLLIFGLLAIFVIFIVGDDARESVGYVDNSGVLAQAESTTVEGIFIRPYPNEVTALEALDEEEIQGYYVIPHDYLDTHALSLYVRDSLPPLAETSFQYLLQKHLLTNSDDAIRNRLLAGADISVHTIDKAEDESIRTLVKGSIVFIALFAIIFILGDVAGYSAMIVEDERENRTLEMMMTTVTPYQFIIGKIIGLIAVTLTRPSIWFLMAFPFMVALFMRVPPAYRQMIDWSFILLLILFVVPGIVLFFGLMTVASVVVDDPRYSGQMGSLLSTVLIFSIFIGIYIILEEDNSVTLFFSFFPLTSFMVIVMRQVMADVPWWQLSLSWLILIGSAIGSLWLAVRFFRSGRLFSGRPFQWRTVWQKFRFRRST